MSSDEEDEDDDDDDKPKRMLEPDPPHFAPGGATANPPIPVVDSSGQQVGTADFDSGIGAYVYVDPQPVVVYETAEPVVWGGGGAEDPRGGTTAEDGSDPLWTDETWVHRRVSCPGSINNTLFIRAIELTDAYATTDAIWIGSFDSQLHLIDGSDRLYRPGDPTQTYVRAEGGEYIGVACKAAGSGVAEVNYRRDIA
jgi:hypothetical protein